MTFGKALFARLGSFSRKKPAMLAETDTFDLRLARIGSRERRVVTRPVLFRTKSEPLAA